MFWKKRNHKNAVWNSYSYKKYEKQQRNAVQNSHSKKGKTTQKCNSNTHTRGGLRDLKVGKTNKCPSMNGLDPSLNAVLKTV